jgi:hypothetical protein
MVVRKALDSKRQINDLDPLVAVDDAFAPYRVEIGEGPFPTASQADFPVDFDFST